MYKAKRRSLENSQNEVIDLTSPAPSSRSYPPRGISAPINHPPIRKSPPKAAHTLSSSSPTRERSPSNSPLIFALDEVEEEEEKEGEEIDEDSMFFDAPFSTSNSNTEETHTETSQKRVEVSNNQDQNTQIYDDATDSSEEEPKTQQSQEAPTVANTKKRALEKAISIPMKRRASTGLEEFDFYSSHDESSRKSVERETEEEVMRRSVKARKGKSSQEDKKGEKQQHLNALTNLKSDWNPTKRKNNTSKIISMIEFPSSDSDDDESDKENEFSMSPSPRIHEETFQVLMEDEEPATQDPDLVRDEEEPSQIEKRPMGLSKGLLKRGMSPSRWNRNVWRKGK